ncbi:MAG: futalosine hydrolase [Planctomycetota bacterium]
MPDLICIPTELERDKIAALLSLDPSDWRVETVGFGVVQASIGTLTAITRWRPRRVILAGIAGRFHGADASVGEALLFDSVRVDGIGVGQGDDFSDAWSLDWPWAGEQVLSLTSAATASKTPRSKSADRELLTVCSASRDVADAAWRAERFPDAVAEDMEGYAVALACRSADLPLSIVRGLSNEVGQRDRSTWRIHEALVSTAQLIQSITEQPG